MLFCDIVKAGRVLKRRFIEAVASSLVRYCMQPPSACLCCCARSCRRYWTKLLSPSVASSGTI